jgi:predicted ATPase
VADVGSIRFDAPVTFLVGENGSGKSTLIEALARVLKFDMQGGSTDDNPLERKLDYENPLAAALAPALGPCKPRTGFFLRAESFFNVANRIDKLDDLAAALSVTSALAFLAVMARLSAAGSQFVVATHSPILLSLPGARIYELSERGAEQVGWEDCDATRLTKSFLDNPDRFLREALRED